MLARSTVDQSIICLTCWYRDAASSKLYDTWQASPSLNWYRHIGPRDWVWVEIGKRILPACVQYWSRFKPIVWSIHVECPQANVVGRCVDEYSSKQMGHRLHSSLILAEWKGSRMKKERIWMLSYTFSEAKWCFGRTRTRYWSESHLCYFHGELYDDMLWSELRNSQCDRVRKGTTIESVFETTTDSIDEPHLRLCEMS